MTLGPPGLLIQSTAADGLVRLHNHGSNHHVDGGADEDPCYSRFAYSTGTGPTSDGVPDNHFGLLTKEECHPGPRRPARQRSRLGGIPVRAAAGPARCADRLGDPRARPRGTPRPPGHRGRTGHPRPPDRLGHHPRPHFPAAPRARLRGGSTPTGRRINPVRADSDIRALHGATGPAPSLFIALASLTAEPDPSPVHTLADIQVTGHTVRVTWQNGTTCQLVLDSTSPTVRTEDM